MADPLRTLKPVEPALDALRYLADQCVNRPLIHELVTKDLERWPVLSPVERRAAFERAFRRVGAVCPWTRSKGRVLDAAQSLGLAP